MSTYASVQSFVKKITKELHRIDGFICNAGLMIDAWSQTEGMETSMFVNNISTVFLGALMMPKLKEYANKFNTKPTLVFIVSVLEYIVKRTGVVITMVAPGLCTTGLGRDARTFTKIMHEAVRAMMAQTAEVGSRTILHGLLLGEEGHGKLLSGCKIKESWVPTWLTNEEAQKLQKDIWNKLVSRLESVQPGYISQLK